MLRRTLGGLLLSLAFCYVTSIGYGASPSLSSITPRGGQRGTEITISFNGSRLNDAAEIVFYTPGFSVGKLEVVNGAKVNATVKIASDCRLGEHAMRVRTKSGISELRTFWVGPFAAVAEKEPNTDFETPQKIALNVTVEGVVTSEDVDYFSVEMKKGQRLAVEVEGMRLANTMFDPFVAILDSKRFELATSDDTPLLKQDGTCAVVVPEDGTYIVQMRESAYGGSGACRYRLHVGTFPRPLGVYPAGGKVGTEVEVRFLGDPAGELSTTVKLPAQPDAEFGVLAKDAAGVAPSENPFRVSEFANVLEAEPNDTQQTGTMVPVLPVACNGIIEKPGDVDYFKFTAKKGQVFDVRCYARAIGSPLDSVMRINYLGGGGVASNDDSGGPDSAFRFTAPADKEYVLSVTDHLGNGGPTYLYRVEFAPVRPTTTVSLPRVSRNSQERMVIPVPRGNRYAALVSVSRANLGGEVAFGGELLPGMTMHAEKLPNGFNVFPVVFEAAPDAPMGGKLTKITGLPTDGKTTVATDFTQKLDLIISSPGQSVYWSKEVNRVAVAVTEEAPFKISIVEPKVPLVQRGSMQLKIVAERKEGFKAPITIRPLYNPPGVSSATSTTIPEGKNEAYLRMNAATNARVGTWKTAVLGTATVNGGPLYVSSQLATYEVAAPLVSFAMERSASEQGKDTEMFLKITQNTPFEGEAKVQLLGLPAKVATTEMKITKESKDLAFKLTIDKASPAGRHRNIFCRVTFMKNGEPIVMDTGGSELRIDKPLPPKPNAPPKPVVKKPTKPAPKPTKPPEKRLTRLEKLRLEQEEREKAAKEGQK